DAATGIEAEDAHGVTLPHGSDADGRDNTAACAARRPSVGVTFDGESAAKTSRCRALTYDRAVTRAVVIVAIVAIACHGREPGGSRPAMDDAWLAQLLRDADAHGAALVTEVATGAVVASAASGREIAAPVLPLSVIKLYVAALWWQHGLGDGELVY